MPETTEPAPFKFVEVEWADAKSVASWVERADFPKPPTVWSRGWLVSEELEYIVIAATVSEDGSFGEVTAIPMGMVLNLAELREEPC